MTVNNSNIKDLKGIEGASSSLKILWLFGNELKSFSGIEKCKNLEICAVWELHHLIDMLNGNTIWDDSMERPKDV